VAPAAHAIVLAWALVLVLAIAACGAEPPQIPKAYATKFGSGVGGIANACGGAYRLHEFARHDHRALARLEAAASASAAKLADVYGRNPEWIFQGETLRQVVDSSVSLLESCGLNQTRARLLRATSQGRRP
jgi:hypothetical protein